MDVFPHADDGTRAGEMILTTQGFTLLGARVVLIVVLKLIENDCVGRVGVVGGRQGQILLQRTHPVLPSLRQGQTLSKSWQVFDGVLGVGFQGQTEHGVYGSLWSDELVHLLTSFEVEGVGTLGGQHLVGKRRSRNELIEAWDFQGAVQVKGDRTDDSLLAAIECQTGDAVRYETPRAIEKDPVAPVFFFNVSAFRARKRESITLLEASKVLPIEL